MENCAVYAAPFGDFRPMVMQLWREMAQNGQARTMADDRSETACERQIVNGSPSNRPATYCQYRYPSPRRSGPLRARPTPFALLRAGSMALGTCKTGDLRQSTDAAQKTLVLQAQSSDSAPNKTKQNKGSYLCNLSVLSSPLRPSVHFLRASTTILNAALQALPLVRSSQTAQVAMRLPVRSLGAPLAHCVTKSRASAAKTSTSFGAPNLLNRRAGYPCAAVLRLRPEYPPKSLGAHNV